MQFSSIILSALPAILGVAGMAISSPSTLLESHERRQLHGGLLDGLGHIIDPIINPPNAPHAPEHNPVNDLIEGVLDVPASLVGMQPLIDACNQPSIYDDPEVFVALTYTDNPSEIHFIKYGDCSPYDTDDKGSMDLVYWCKPAYCHPMGDDQCSGPYGNIGPTPLPLPAGFFLPNYLKVADVFGYAAYCTYDSFLGGL